MKGESRLGVRHKLYEDDLIVLGGSLGVFHEPPNKMPYSQPCTILQQDTNLVGYCCGDTRPFGHV